MSNVHVSILSPHDMGKLSGGGIDVEGEFLLSMLVSDPTKTVAALTTGDAVWPKEETRIVAELAAAATDEERKPIKKQIPAIVPARFTGERRVSEECIGRQVVGHDFDHVAAETFEAACETIRSRLPDRFLAVHTTATERNADGTWRLRVFELLEREATPAEWESRVKPHMRSLGEHDPKALDVVRLLYMPVRTAGYRFRVYEGPRTILDALAAAAPVQPAPVAPAPRASTAAPAADRRRAMALALGAAWPARGRHEAQLALAGALRSEGFAADAALDFLCTVCATAGDEDRPKREDTIRHTYDRPADAPTTGWTRLREHVDGAILDAARELIGKDADFKRLVAEKLDAVRAQSAETAPKTERLTPAQRAMRLVGRDVTRLRTGLPTLDVATRGGILLRKVVVVGGAPGAGKTALLVRLAYTWLSQGVPVGILASDEDADGLLTRLGQLHGLPRDAIERGDPVTCQALADWCATVPLLLSDGDEDGGTIESLSRELRALATGRPSAMLVDSIQTARSEAQVPTGTDARAKIDAIVRALKYSAKVDGHLVAASSELSRAAYRNKDAAENANALAAFKESGGIEYGVSLAVVLSSRQGTSELVDAAVVKNRLGPGKPEFMLRLDHDRADVRETTEQDARAADPLYLVKHKIKAALEQVAGAPLAKRQLAERVGGRTSIACRAVDEMLDAHELHQEPRGIRFPLPGEPGFVIRQAG